MKKKNVLLLFAGCCMLFLFSAGSILYGDGEAGKTGSPGESTCTSCHSQSSSGSGSVTINTNITGGVYTLGQTYQISVVVAQSGCSLFAFDLEALLNSNNNNAGTFVITNSNETKISTATISGSMRNNVVHTGNGNNTANSHTFNFNWTAPATDQGAFTFYTTGLACDNNGHSSGDKTYATTMIVQSPVSAGIQNYSPDKNVIIIYNRATSCIHLFLNNTGNSVVRGNLYSISGQKVCELFNETMTGKVEKDYPVSSRVTKGLYYIRIEQANKTITKKLMIE